ncbi:cyclic nucleotide-binding domain-containing protein [Streptomyces sp. M19]
MRTATTNLLGALPAEGRKRIEALAREAAFAPDTRIFDEGRAADRFWVIRTGAVILDLRVPGRRPAAVETLGHGDLLGWSWLFPPYVWHFGAVTLSPVRAAEFDAVAVRALCAADPELGHALTLRTAEIIAHRLIAARSRLLDLYGPYGSAEEP